VAIMARPPRYQLATKESFFASLEQDGIRERIEIDFVDFRGPAFVSWDRRTVLAYLVHAGLTEAEINHFWGHPADIADSLGVLLLTWNQAFRP
jgi:hypothetical protein